MIAAVVAIQLVEFTSGTGVEHCKAIFTCGKEDTMNGIFVRIVCTGMLLPVQCAESVIPSLIFLLAHAFHFPWDTLPQLWFLI